MSTTTTFPRHVLGTWTLASSMVHGGDEVLGTTKLFRTEGLIYQGRKIQVPVVSGNAIGGVWRRYMAQAFLDAYLDAGGEPLSRSAFYYLTSGGALKKGKESGSLDLAAERELRRLVPYVGLFGGAGLGKIQAGKIYIDHAWPVCRETLPLLSRIWPEVEDAATAQLSIRELTEIHGYSRKDDAKDENWHRYLSAEARAETTMAIERIQEDDVADEAGNPQQMRYEQQELVAGAVLFHRWGFRWPATRDELAGLGAGLLRWAERAHAGGRNSRGHGNVLPRYIGVTPDTKLLGTGEAALDAFREQTVDEAVRQHVRKNIDDIVRVLRSL